MKKMIMAAVLASLAPASAFADKIVAEVAAVDAQISSVQLTDTGALNIQRKDGRQIVKQLSSANAGKFKFDVETLASAELTTDHHQVICMIVPQYTNTLKVADANGELRVILSPRGCFVRDYTHPKEDGIDEIANQLEDNLILLATQFGEK